jgi:FKBP-type peptidyl-prolyl cis-trans isomerase
MLHAVIHRGLPLVLLALLVGACDTAESPPEVDVEDLVVGEGDEAETGRIHTVHYVGRLVSTGRVFLTTCTEDAPPFSFVLGDPALIEGWNRGLLGTAADEQMREQGIRRLVIPPALAWGRRGAGCDANGENCDVPGGEAVEFLIQLFDVRDTSTPSPVPDDTTCAEPLRIAAAEAL